MVSVGERYGLLPEPQFRAVETPEGLLVSRVSTFSGKRNEMLLPIKLYQFKYWRQGQVGGLIQDIFPELTPDQREFLLTGATPKEWDEAFPPEEDEL